MLFLLTDLMGGVVEPTNDMVFRRAKPKWKETMALWLPALILCVLATMFVAKYVEAPPPTHVVLATGSPGGAYASVGQRYAQALGKRGIRVSLRPSDGSLENLHLLSTGEADLAFVQGGLRARATTATAQSLQSLASLYHEPVWLFYRADNVIERLSELRGWRVSIGSAGSGTQNLSRLLLSLNGLDETNTTLAQFSPADAMGALRAGMIDALFLIAGPQAQVVQELLHAPDTKLMSFRRHGAYASKLEHIDRVELSEGVLDLEGNMPTSDTTLLATTATLVAREDAHPGLVQLVLEVAHELHAQGSILDKPGTFPSQWYVDMPLNPVAERYFRSGPTTMYRFLPFWAVILVTKLAYILIPLITLSLPMLKIAPSLYRWGMRSRIFRWYTHLREIEETLDEDSEPDHLRQGLRELVRLRDEVATVRVPYTYMQEVYNLRLHIDLVAQGMRDKLTEACASCSPAPDDPADNPEAA